MAVLVKSGFARAKCGNESSGDVEFIVGSKGSLRLISQYSSGYVY